MISWLFCKPKVIFGDSYIECKSRQREVIVWYIPVINLRRYGWPGYFWKRSEAIECRVRIEFIMDSNLLYRFAEPWADLPIGKSIPADSFPNGFPIASADWDGNIYLPGTPISTNSPIPPYKIPKQSHIIANIQVTSKKKIIAESKWSMDTNSDFCTPIILRRL